MVDYFMAYNLSKFDGWALIGAWVATERIQYMRCKLPIVVNNIEKWGREGK